MMQKQLLRPLGLTTAVLVFFSCTFAGAQSTAPARYISPLDCIGKGKQDGMNIIENGGLRFKVSQKGHDEYNKLTISKTTKVSGVTVGSFCFSSLPTRDELDNGHFSKKLHFDIYDYANLNGNKKKELIRGGDRVFATFLVKFPTQAPNPEPGSKLDNGDRRFKRNLFFQFWPGGVSTHLNSYPHDSTKGKQGRFGYVTVQTGPYGANQPVLSREFEVEKDRWYRMYFEYNPDVQDGKIAAWIAPHKPDLQTKDMTELIDLRGNTLYEETPNRLILPTFGIYHTGACATKVTTCVTEVLLSRDPIAKHSMLQGSEHRPKKDR